MKSAVDFVAWGGEEREAGAAAEEFGEEAVALCVERERRGPVEVPCGARRWFGLRAARLTVLRQLAHCGGNAGVSDGAPGGGGAECVAGGNTVGGGLAADVDAEDV